MDSAPANGRVYDFDFPQLETQIRVEEIDDCIVIRATRDSFNEERKRSFVRELASEGFIPERCLWFPVSNSESYLGVSWIVDPSWACMVDRPMPPWPVLLHRFVVAGGLALVGVLACFLVYRL